MPFIKGQTKTGGRQKGTTDKKTQSQERQREIFNTMVDAKWKPLIEAQIVDAMNNFKARHYIFDQRIGKAKESIEHSGEIKGLILDG